ncbi:hypothetical protein ElyMa_002491300 [Elysia marginata]|uniref:Uncharacterized protein n=1 Tax=Elysia marginata TaxID=1093978 RepID=A0AAV4GNJ8_9GAST|nr:hypothetical protein ElyMa_002491300 [Elysia marginata]
MHGHFPPAGFRILFYRTAISGERRRLTGFPAVGRFQDLAKIIHDLCQSADSRIGNSGGALKVRSYISILPPPLPSHPLPWVSSDILVLGSIWVVKLFMGNGLL